MVEKKPKEKLFKLTLKRMPKDVRDFVLDEQMAVKKDRDIQFSMESTIYKLLYTHPKFKV
jgi:hypothetical protein